MPQTDARTNKSAVLSVGLLGFVVLLLVAPLFLFGGATSLLSKKGFVDAGLTGPKLGLVALSGIRLRKGLFEARGEVPLSVHQCQSRRVRETPRRRVQEIRGSEQSVLCQD